MSENNRLRKLRKKAAKVGYGINKGFQHWLSEGYPIFRDCYGDRSIGYNVIDWSTGFNVWGSYNNMMDHLWNLDDVEEFIKGEYERLGLSF